MSVYQRQLLLPDKPRFGRKRIQHLLGFVIKLMRVEGTPCPLCLCGELFLDGFRCAQPLLRLSGGFAMKVLIKSAWGSDDPTKAAFAFLHANAFAEAGHEVRIFLLGEAVNLMKDELIASVTPVGWPPLSEIMAKTVVHKIPISV